MSVRMVKICDESLVQPLFNIFQFSLETGNFPSNWKRGNIVPVHKKGDKNLINNHRLTGLFFQFSVQFMKSVFMIHFIITLRVMICFLRVSPAFVKVFLACLNYYP